MERGWRKPGKRHALSGFVRRNQFLLRTQQVAILGHSHQVAGRPGFQAPVRRLGLPQVTGGPMGPAGGVEGQILPLSSFEA